MIRSFLAFISYNIQETPFRSFASLFHYSEMKNDGLLKLPIEKQINKQNFTAHACSKPFLKLVLVVPVRIVFECAVHRITEFLNSSRGRRPSQCKRRFPSLPARAPKGDRSRRPDRGKAHPPTAFQETRCSRSSRPQNRRLPVRRDPPGSFFRSI